MSERKLPSTSHDAYKQSNELSVAHKKKIMDALQYAESMTYEDISVFTGIDKHGIGRRLSELIKEGKIYRTDIKRQTSSGRSAFCVALVGAGLPKAEEPKLSKSKPTKESKVIADIPTDKILVDKYLRTKPGANKFQKQAKFIQQKIL